MPLVLALVILVWVVCGVLSYGSDVAFFQRKFPTERRRSDGFFALFPAISGPIGVISFVIFSKWFASDSGGSQRVWRYGLQFVARDAE